MEFQFHKGAIRTIREANRRDGFLGFNSIKMQLEQRQPSRRSLSFSFQFHKGAIRTTLRLCMALVLLRFNSIKVQLERLMLLVQ